ncbi:MAG: GWxTD domain-containing protein [Flavobacteriales bacterium]
MIRIRPLKKALIGPLILVLIGSGCGGGDRWQKDGREYFEKTAQGFDPSFRIYHASPDSSLLFFRVQHDQLLYARPATKDPFRAKVKVRTRLLDQDGELLSVDSTSLEDQGRDQKGRSWGSLRLGAPSDLKKGVLKVEAVDMNRNRRARKRLSFDRKNPNASQNFLPIRPKDSMPFFKDHFPAHKKVALRYERQKPDMNRVKVSVYKREFPLPPPPFAEDGFQSFDQDPDSIFSIVPDGGDAFTVRVPDSGFYHFQVDKEGGKGGYTLFNFSKGYPKVKTVEALLGPIRYLTSKEEFKRLRSKEDMKAAIDSFWIEKGGSEERGRKLIEAYYSRVETANRHFTSHVEGWKTDRGLIHVIFGKPARIERKGKVEEWVYGEESEIMTLSFEFTKVKNPFSSNDMALDRNPMYKSAWYRAVETWRNGRVHSH